MEPKVNAKIASRADGLVKKFYDSQPPDVLLWIIDSTASPTKCIILKHVTEIR